VATTFDDVAPPREIDPQGVYHVMSRGSFRQRVFLDDDHHMRYLQLLQRVTDRRRWIVLDWCLMPNHVHLVIQLTEGGLSSGMRELNGCFSRWSNVRTGRTNTGHLWKNRFKSLDLVDDVHFRQVLRYVPNNPVAAGLVAHPEDWPWSGYRATIGLEYPYKFHQPPELLRYFADRPALALRRYMEFVNSSPVPDEHDIWSDQDVEPPGWPMVESAA
jgi:REP element-mobilizing transposase RayT